MKRWLAETSRDHLEDISINASSRGQRRCGRDSGSKGAATGPLLWRILYVVVGPAFPFSAAHDPFSYQWTTRCCHHSMLGFLALILMFAIDDDPVARRLKLMRTSRIGIQRGEG